MNWLPEYRKCLTDGGVWSTQKRNPRCRGAYPTKGVRRQALAQSRKFHRAKWQSGAFERRGPWATCRRFLDDVCIAADGSLVRREHRRRREWLSYKRTTMAHQRRRDALLLGPSSDDDIPF